MTTIGWFIAGAVLGVALTLLVLVARVMHEDWMLRVLRDEDERAEEGIRFRVGDWEDAEIGGLFEIIDHELHIREMAHRGDREDCEIEHGEAPKKRGQL